MVNGGVGAPSNHAPYAHFTTLHIMIYPTQEVTHRPTFHTGGLVVVGGGASIPVHSRMAFCIVSLGGALRQANLGR